MRKIILTTFVFIQSFVFSQTATELRSPINGTLINVNDSNTSQIYRGYSNEFQFRSINTNLSDSIIFKTYDCQLSTIERDSLGYSFYIRSYGPNKNAKLVVSNLHLDSIVYNFNVSNFPVPMTFLNNISSLEKVNLNNLTQPIEIKASYENLVSFRATFIVKKWEVLINNKIFLGSGSILSEEVINEISRLNSGDQFELIFEVEGNDKVYRKEVLFSLSNKLKKQ